MKFSAIAKYFVYGVLLLITAVLLLMVARQVIGFDEIHWRGQKFKLKKKYLGYEEYKSDIDQLPPSEIERVKTAMLSVSVPKTAGSDKALVQGLRQMRFPGFGSSFNGNVKDEQGNRYVLEEYEIPQKKEQRTLLYRVEPDGSCRKVLDGVSIDHDNDHKLGNTEAKVEGKFLRHYMDGKMYREIPLDPQ